MRSLRIGLRLYAMALKNRSGSFQTAPPPLSDAAAGEYHWRICARSVRFALSTCRTLAVQLAGIRLRRRPAKHALIAHLLRDQLIQLLYLCRSHRQTAPRSWPACRSSLSSPAASPCSAGTPHPPDPSADPAIQMRGALAHRGRLGRLEMGERQRRQILILQCEIPTARGSRRTSLLTGPAAMPRCMMMTIRIVPDIAGGCAQMDDRASPSGTGTPYA